MRDSTNTQKIGHSRSNIWLMALLAIVTVIKAQARRFKDKIYGENILRNVTLNEPMKFRKALGFTPYINITVESSVGFKLLKFISNTIFSLTANSITLLFLQIMMISQG
jgi:hypothetical protein